MRHHNSVPLPRRNIEFIALAGVALVAPFVFPEYKTQLAFLWVFILFALTWDLQGGQMGYNSFGNIVFFGLGMYVATAVQIGIALTSANGRKPVGKILLRIPPRNILAALLSVLLPPVARR